MSHFRPLAGLNPRHLLLVAVLPLLVLAVGQGFEVYLSAQTEQRQRVEVLRELSTLRARLEGVITRNASLVRGLVAVVAYQPEITPLEFQRLARELFRQPLQLRNIALAPDMVITHIYPLAGNEQALGLNYLVLPKQRAAALRVKESGEMVVAGPVNLVQGGVGFIARAPVFLLDAVSGDRIRFWGLVASVIDARAVYREAGVDAATQRLRIALRGRDGLGEQGEVFLGGAELFAGGAVVQRVLLPGGSWEIAGMPLGGWRADHPNVWQVRLATWLIALLVLTVGLLWLNYRRQRSVADKELGRMRTTLMAAIEQSTAGVIMADAPDGRLSLINSAAVKMRRLNPQEVLGRSFFDLGMRREVFHPDGRPFEDDELPLARAIRRGDNVRNLEMVIRRGDRERWVLANAAPVRDDSGEITAGVLVFSDITETKQAEEQIRYRAYNDLLTGLPNRARFLEFLGRAVRESRRHQLPLALLFIDLDRFKVVNDTLGHDVGDALLKAAAARLGVLVRSTDLVARLGGDEFTVVLTDLTHTDHVTVIAGEVVEALARPFKVAGHEIYSSASVGITLCPADGEDATTLLKNADMAMYQAKERGRNTFHYFTRQMTERAETFVTVEKELRVALQRDELMLEYQPVYHLDSGEPAAVEALVRWRHPERGIVPPGRFIPVAEETGLIIGLGEWVLRTACRELSTLAGWVGQPALRLSVNVSSRQFRGGFGAGAVQAILGEMGFPADRLVLEITESLLMDDDPRVSETLHALQEAGVGIAIDDFGTGFSSLGYLRRFPVSLLKIDRSFVRDLGDDPRDTRLVEAIVAMARSLDLGVVAEGVETRRQLEMLRGFQCEFVQGYLLGRPVAAADLGAVLSEGQAAARG